MGNLPKREGRLLQSEARRIFIRRPYCCLESSLLRVSQSRSHIMAHMWQCNERVGCMTYQGLQGNRVKEITLR